MNWGELITFHPTITIPILKHHQVPLVTPEVAATVATSKAPGPQARQSRATMSAVVNFPSITQLQARELWENQQNILIYRYNIYIYHIIHVICHKWHIFNRFSYSNIYIYIYIYIHYIYMPTLFSMRSILFARSSLGCHTPDASCQVSSLQGLGIADWWTIRPFNLYAWMDFTPSSSKIFSIQQLSVVWNHPYNHGDSIIHQKISPQIRLCQGPFIHQYPHYKVESWYHLPRPSK